MKTRREHINTSTANKHTRALTSNQALTVGIFPWAFFRSANVALDNKRKFDVADVLIDTDQMYM